MRRLAPWPLPVLFFFLVHAFAVINPIAILMLLCALIHAIVIIVVVVEWLRKPSNHAG